LIWLFKKQRQKIAACGSSYIGCGLWGSGLAHACESLASDFTDQLSRPLDQVDPQS
jgi:hypothetical protein